jgi:phage terminase large subunit
MKASCVLICPTAPKFACTALIIQTPSEESISTGLVMDEAADVSPRVFNEILRPALSDRQGWCVWIGTPKGQNDFYELYNGDARTWIGAKNHPEWFTMTLRASLSGLVDDDELRSARQMMSPEQYAQEYECSWTAAIIGAYYGREMEEGRGSGAHC